MGGNSIRFGAGVAVLGLLILLGAGAWILVLAGYFGPGDAPETPDVTSGPNVNERTPVPQTDSPPAQSPDINTETPKLGEDYEFTFLKLSGTDDKGESVRSYVLIEITNISPDALYLYQVSAAYENEDGAMRSITGSYQEVFPHIIMPGEKGYYVAENVFIPDEESGPPVIDLIPAGPSSMVFTNDELIMLPVTDVSFADTQTGIELQCKVENTTGEEQSEIGLVAVFFDGDGNPLGMIHNGQGYGGYGDGYDGGPLQPGEVREFKNSSYSSFPFHLTYDMVSSHTVYAYVLPRQN